MAYAWQARHGLTAAQYQATFNSLVSQGYRLIDVSGYGVGGVDRYDAVWEQSPGPAWQARHGLSAAEHQALFNDLTRQGYRPVRVSGYEVGGQARYASIWHKTDGPPFRARHGLTAAELQAEYDALTPQGYHPVDVSGYSVGGQPRFAAIWEKSPIAGWVARHGLSPSEYQAQFNQWANEGYILLRVSGYEVGGQNFYTAIWIQGPALTWFSRHGLTDAEYQADFNAMVARGFRLVKVSGYPLRGTARHAAIWHKPSLSDAEQAFIDQTVTTFMNNHRVPGLSLALAHRGRLVLSQAFGLANTATNERVTTNHLFRIASVSKPITSVAVFRLIEAGRLNLGDRVFGPNSILGNTYGTLPANSPINQITVQHLLEHTSGWATSQDPMFTMFNLNQDELITWMLDPANNRPLTHTPGTRFEYLNFGYLVLGRVIEQVSGQTYADYVRQNVLAPSGITDMHIAGDTLAQRRPNEVVYYSQTAAWNPYAIRVSRMDAHGGWIASAKDLVKFALRVDGFATVPDILRPATLGTMITPTTAPRPDMTPANYAKGWAINALGNYWHLGDLPGTASILVRTNNQYVWAILANSRNDAQLDQMRADIDALMWTIINRITDWPAGVPG
ncbi:serine hydrolase [Brevibacillus dissolubilis]|uniref:serine hydrolase n=1 Tax=Brevibacillus dissolubilis TaxID=1844116 RepID=UPI001117A472|nr:serine hydrolase [Brevibacillus dissolubilis]